MIWMGALAVIAFASVVLPLAFRKVEAVDAADATPVVLADQLEEVQRDFERNLISKAEADAARVEIKRRILASARAAASQARLSRSEGRRSLWLAALFVPALAAGYYLIMGSPEVASLAYADRQEERAEQRQIEELTEKLYARLMTDPDGGASEGWRLLGQTYARMGKYPEAVRAFEVLTTREDATSETFSRLAEALINAENGIVTPKAENTIDRAILLDSSNPAGAFYKSVALEQRGEEAEAHTMLVSMLEASDGFAPWMEAFVGRANSLAEKLGRDPVSLSAFAPAMASTPGPTAEDVAAAGEMSEQDRSDFIRSMVERLASRLEDEPNDIDGWIRLANAYNVLGEQENARDALEQASGLLSTVDERDPRHDIVINGLRALD